MISRINAGLTNGWVFMIDSGTFYFQSRSGGTTSSAQVSVSSLTNATWHHFVAARTSGSKCELYLDGALIHTSVDASDAITASGDLEVGSYGGGAGAFLGMMQDVFVHNGTVLSSADVRNIYNYQADIANSRRVLIT